MPNKTILRVKSRQLAFFDHITDKEPQRYLDRGEKVELLGSVTFYGGKHKDKEYSKVQTDIYETGYVLSEGLEAIDK